jgi:pimeloyl-ACP methyl ester carboxylesterase
LVTTNPSPELTVTVEVRGPGGQVWSKAFQIRRPPIVLVHGYASDNSTWAQAWLDTLTNNVPSDFVRKIEYGVDHSKADKKDYPNTSGRLDSLARLLHGALARIFHRTS